MRHLMVLKLERCSPQPPHTLVKQLVCSLLHVPGAGAQGHPGCPLLNAHVFQLPQHSVKLWVLEKKISQNLNKGKSNKTL